MRGDWVFLFLAAASIAFFSFLIAHHWIDARTAERRARERFALLRKLADQPTDAVQRVIDLVREDDAREALREQQKWEAARREELKGGVILMAVGIALSFFLGSLTGTQRLWAVGFIPAAVGVVVFAFAYFNKGPRAEA
jgi:hypothetical protein